MGLEKGDTMVWCRVTRHPRVFRGLTGCQWTPGFLGTIYTNIYGAFTPLAMGGYKYFITFIEDYSRYGFVELNCEKSESFEAFKAKVELQQGKKIKAIHSDKGGEYFGKYD